MINIISKLSKREKYILYISVTIIGLVLFDKAVLSPVTNKITKLNEEIDLQEKKLQRYLYILTQEDAITEEHKKYTQNVKQSSSDEEEKSKLLSVIEELARKSSVLLKNMKPGTTEREGPYNKYTVDIETESKIAYLADFMYQLEKSPRLLRVKEFNLAPVKSKSSTIKSRMTITQLLVAPDKKEKEPKETEAKPQ
ncbi:MAG: type 4a pilus biogenesis protein PilO [Candidatus Omnitrophica bacterium]|nr:type 4a pilus biogenesis protein PilO [Candidatus Omnitrophota bacterium]